MKTCNKCGQEKPLSEFYTANGKALATCKPCYRIYSRKHRRLYYARHLDRVLASNKRWKKAHPERRKKYGETPKKISAINKVHYAVKTGKLIKPPNCEECNDCTRLEGHHYKGYEPEFALTVKWLCNPCHRTAHK